MTFFEIEDLWQNLWFKMVFSRIAKMFFVCRRITYQISCFLGDEGKGIWIKSKIGDTDEFGN